MATLALDRPAVMEPTSTKETDAPGLPQVLESFAEVIEAIDSDASLDETVQLLARKICLLVGCSRCGVYLKHSESGLYRCQAIECSQPHGDDRIRRLICGTTADGLTHEILATKEPVLVRNAQADPRAVRSIMRTFGVRSILGVPMIVREDVVGILFLDNEQEPHTFSEQHQAVASTFAQLAGVAIQQAQRAADLRTTMRTIARQNELLQHCAAIDERLTRLVLEGGTLADIAEAAADLTGKPCTIHDAAFRRLAVVRPPGTEGLTTTVLDADHRGLAEVEEALASMKPNRPAVIGPSPSAGLLHRFLVMPVVMHGEGWGYLVLMEFGSRFTALDAAVSKRAATAVALEMSVERRAAVADRHARQAFVRDLVTGLEDQVALVRRGELLGFRASAPHVVALLAPAGDSVALHPEAVEQAWLGVGQAEPIWAATVPHGGLAILVELNESGSRPAALAQVKDVVDRLVSRVAHDQPVVAAISGVCAAPADYLHGHGEASQILTSLTSLRGDGDEALSVLAADDLGAGLLLLNAVERDDADRFTRNTLGPLLAGGSRTVEELLVTVRVFFENGRSVRNSARHLSVHENTIRYRLGRVLDLTGLDIATDSDAQLTVQVALLILKIQGRLPATTGGPAASLE